MVGSLVLIAATTIAAALKNNLSHGIDPTVETTVDKKDQKPSKVQKEIDSMTQDEFQSFLRECLIEELESPEIREMIRQHVIKDMEKFEKKQAQEREFENSEWRINYRNMTEEERDEFWNEKDKLVNFYGDRWMKRHHKDARCCDPSDPTIETVLDELIPGEGREMVIMTPSGTWKNGIRFHNKKADELLKKKKAKAAV